MSFVAQLTDQLSVYANLVPLEIFVFVGAGVEEILAPIPSPIVMTIAGSIAVTQNKLWTDLLILAVIGAAGKTIGCYILYIISDKLEDVVVGRFGKLFGLSHKTIESLGKHFSGGLKDDIIIFLARALPIIPTAPVSIVCGVIKIRLRTYLVSTFLGTIIRNLFYLYLGYIGLAGYGKFISQFESVEKIATVTIGLALVAGIVVYLYAKNKDKLFEKLQNSVPNHPKK